MKTAFKYLLHIILLCCFYGAIAATHDIVFCGENIPVENTFVAAKLMNFIQGQKNTVSYPELRRRKELYFPTIEYYLRKTGLPEDFKYLAIVESGFTLEISKVGARGFWQIMPGTARDYGLTMTDKIDDRDDINKATFTACKILATYYKQIQKKYGISSWVLTAAAYNFGIGNILKAIDRQGKDYFSMNLNAETAAYVYKIIAIKELFEFPELYIKDFGYNMFSTAKILTNPQDKVDTHTSTDEFNTMVVKVNEQDGSHTQNLIVPANIEVPSPEAKKKIKIDFDQKKTIKSAHIIGKYKDFNDGGEVLVLLEEDLQVKGKFVAKGNIIKGTGWIIEDRVYIDLGYNQHDVILYDKKSQQGIAKLSLKNGEPILLKVDNTD